ncbi:hypothetical protein RN001_004820 [Aquatica leii]|uniref:CLIP domain-containing serine protease n=1 Tax=Aquatica leii TaxID=1421715 RepID=A0AAN7PF50_9COLE|nr:hypothetical protein RN001_004820 [Aquatica leii]
MLFGFSVAEINTCRENFKCIPLTECNEIKSLIESNNLVNYMQSLSCGYFHEPYVCCARNCETPNGNYGQIKTLNNCPRLKQNEFSNNLSQREFLNDSFVNNTHVCCGIDEDEYKLVEPAPIELPNDLKLSCTTPNGEHANCTHINDCPSYLEAAAEPNKYFQFINDSFCGYWKEPMVCCGSTSYYKETFTNNLPENYQCGLWDTNLHKNIPPWLAVISSTEFVDVCVGVLINHYYVISTTICTGKDHKKLNVRFGECIVNNRFNSQCNNEVALLKPFPLQKFVHADDIGVVLLKLKKFVNAFTTPICLSRGQLPVYQEVQIMGLTRFNNLIINDKGITATTTFTDDCYFGTNFKYICMNSNNINTIRNQSPHQYVVLQLDNGRWYLEGLFNWRSWDESISNYFHAIYVHKFIPWVKSNVS